MMTVIIVKTSPLTFYKNKNIFVFYVHESLTAVAEIAAENIFAVHRTSKTLTISE